MTDLTLWLPELCEETEMHKDPLKTVSSLNTKDYSSLFAEFIIAALCSGQCYSECLRLWTSRKLKLDLSLAFYLKRLIRNMP